MTIVRVGATKKYSQGWESAFGKGKRSAPPAAAVNKSAAKGAKKSAAKVSTKKKSSAKKAKR